MARYDVGVQSVVFREFDLVDAVAELDAVGLDHLEINDLHLSPASEDGTLDAGLDAVAGADLSVCGYGVADLTSPDDAREAVAFAADIGAGYVNVNYPPDADAISEELVSLGRAFGVDVGIHNYSTVHHDDLSRVFTDLDDVRGVLSRFDDSHLGLCVDTGHFLVQDVDPATVVREFGDRVVSVHLKDTSREEVEDAPGRGRLDLPGFVGVLDAHADLDAPLVVEFELPRERTTDALREAVANVRAAMD